MMLFVSISSDCQEMKTINTNASEAFNNAYKAHSSENILDAKFYAQNALAAARETKVALMNTEKSLTELLQTIVNNSENATLIDNINDQKEEVKKALENAIKAYNYAEKACNSIDLEELQINAKQVVNASEKVMKQTVSIQHYSDIINASIK